MTQGLFMNGSGQSCDGRYSHPVIKGLRLSKLSFITDIILFHTEPTFYFHFYFLLGLNIEKILGSSPASADKLPGPGCDDVRGATGCVRVTRVSPPHNN